MKLSFIEQRPYFVTDLESCLGLSAHEAYDILDRLLYCTHWKMC